jgi:hypothetical protein
MIMGNCRTKAADCAALIVSSSCMRYQGLNTGAFHPEEGWNQDLILPTRESIRHRHRWMVLHTS